MPRSFTASSVREHAPPASGVYGVTNATAWIYIGETDNIRESLLRHLLEVDATLRGTRPTGFVYETCDRAARPGRQESLVREYAPSYNRLAMRRR